MKDFLRTPGGVLALIGSTYVAAVVLALVFMFRRDYFERHVRETYAAPTAHIVEVGKRLEAGTNGVACVRGLPRPEQAALYEAWLQEGDTWPKTVPTVMVWAEPDFYLRRARQTLLCGTLEQRIRGVGFLRSCVHPGARSLLAEVVVRARARHEQALAEVAQQALKDRPCL